MISTTLTGTNYITTVTVYDLIIYRQSELIVILHLFLFHTATQSLLLNIFGFIAFTFSITHHMFFSNYDDSNSYKAIGQRASFEINIDIHLWLTIKSNQINT